MAGTPSFTDRIASAVGRHIPWQLPVAALLKEPSFDAVYTAMSPDTTATLPGVDVNVSMVGGLGKVAVAVLLTRWLALRCDLGSSPLLH